MNSAALEGDLLLKEEHTNRDLCNLKIYRPLGVREEETTNYNRQMKDKQHNYSSK